MPTLESWPGRELGERNPFLSILLAGLADLDWVIEDDASRPAVLIFHFPDVAVWPRSLVRTLYRVAVFVWRIGLRSRRGSVIVWMVHNVYSHDARHPRVEETFFRALARLTDAVVFQSQSQRTDALARLPTLNRRPGVVIPHTSYEDHYPRAKRKRNQDGRTGYRFLFFGRLRDYKGVEPLIVAFTAHEADELWIVGSAEDAADELKAFLARPHARTFVRTEFVPAEEIEDVFGSADCCVLPYRSISVPGSALLSLSLSVPVALPRMASTEELAQEFGPNWVFLFDELKGSTFAQISAWLSSRSADPLDLSRRAPHRVARQLSDFLAGLLVPAD